MWRNYNRLYTQILKSEMALLVKAKNVHKIFELSKISVTSNASHYITVKKALLHLSYLNLILGNRGKIVKSKGSSFDTSVKKGSALGSTILLRRDFCFQFINFCLYNGLSQSDTAKPIRKVQFNNISFSIQSPRFFTKVFPSYKFYQEINKIQVVLFFNSFCKENVFLLRFLKFPISNSNTNIYK